jgi:hypothetical protein
MEFIEGQTTESYVARYGPMPLDPALLIAWQVSKALVAAAKQQLVQNPLRARLQAKDSLVAPWRRPRYSLL